MNKSKLFILALAAPMLLTGLTSCGASHKMKHSEFVKNKDYLYDVVYNDYSWGDVTKWLNSKTPNNTGGGMGCSSVHKGNFYARSFDFFYTDMVECVVRTKHENGHYASVGVAISDCKLTDTRVANINKGATIEKDKLAEKLLPFSMVDGINENGVVCNTNVVPAKDLTPHEGEEKYHTRGTNPGKEKLYYQFMPRFVLDNAKSAKHAVELLANRNITAVNSKNEPRDYFGLSGMGLELHMMIGDKDETYVVELIDDKMKISHSNIMTNYYLTQQTESGMGLERFDVLRNGYEDVENLYDMMNLIQQVQYSPCYNTKYIDESGDEKTYTGEEFVEKKWPTEFCGNNFKYDEFELKTTIYNIKQLIIDNWGTEGSAEDGVEDVLQNMYEWANDDERRQPAEGHDPFTPWISTHAEVFDIENKTLHLCTQENYQNWQAYTL